MIRLARRLDRIDISGIRKAFERKGAVPANEDINLALGQPDFDTPAHIKAAAARALEAGHTAYTPNAGIPELREAIAAKLKRENRVSVDPEQVLVTAGASEALHLALMALVNPGDEVLIPDPGFVSYAPLTRAAGGRPVGVPLRKDLTLDRERLEKAVTRKTRVVVVDSPANPTGAVERPEDLKALAELAGERNLILISDEVYEEFIYEGAHASPARWAPGRVVTVNAASKTFAMTGWRLGFAAGPPEVIDGMLRLHCYAQACASSIAQDAALAAYTGPRGGEMRERFRKRRDFVLEALKGAGIPCSRPRGAFYAFPEVGDGDRFAAGAAERGVRVVPGSAFGRRGRSHIRISYAVGEEKLERGMATLAEVFHKNSRRREDF